jgi:CheY-like chemotaxis protein
MKKIIIVEDEEILRNLLHKKLLAEGYSVEVAENGEVGLQKIRENRPDLILLDIIMPKMGGFEMLEEMQKDESISGIPVIVVSNSGQPVEIDRAQKLGAKDWLVKTEFDPQEVIDKVIVQIGKGEEVITQEEIESEAVEDESPEVNETLKTEESTEQEETPKTEETEEEKLS